MCGRDPGPFPLSPPSGLLAGKFTCKKEQRGSFNISLRVRNAANYNFFIFSWDWEKSTFEYQDEYMLN